MLRAACNMAVKDNTLIQEGLRELLKRLPPGWSVGRVEESAPGRRQGEARAEFRAPDGRRGVVGLEVRARLEPRAVRDLIEAHRARQTGEPLVVVARYLSEGTRERIAAGESGYIDLTGNVRIVIPRPGLFITTEGASEDPDRVERSARTLRGPKAGRIVRALIDRKQPPGVREIAALTAIDAGYVSRVLSLLDREALVTRFGRGRIQTVDWPALLRRWALEAPLEARGRELTYLEPRGVSALVSRLAKSSERYAVTGSLAAAAFAPVAPARLATVWVRDAAGSAGRLGLRPADAGANVILVEPGDDDVFQGATARAGVHYAAPSQVAADLLTSPGRGPAEGEELIRWMLANEEAWRQ